MIVLDTHIWIWWVSATLGQPIADVVESNIGDGLGVSIISCWEIAKKVQSRKLDLDQDVSTWIEKALAYPGVQLVDLSPDIVIESTRLPGEFHRDPADQLIVATARILNVPVLTADMKILAYPHVRKVDVSKQ